MIGEKIKKNIKNHKKYTYNVHYSAEKEDKKEKKMIGGKTKEDHKKRTRKIHVQFIVKQKNRESG